MFRKLSPRGVEPRTNKKGRRLFGYFGIAWGSLFVLIGLAVMGAGVNRGLKQRSTADWPSIQGEIIDTHSSPTKGKGPDSPVTYQFKVNGKVYRSSKVAYIDRNNIGYDDWLRLGNGLPDTGNVTIFYNPKDPGDSVLIPGSVSQSWDGLEFGAVFAGFAIAWMIFWWVGSNWLPDRLEKESSQPGSEDVPPNA